MLNLVAPQFAFDPPSSGAELETPINVGVAGIQYPDGSALSQNEARKVGAFIYRVSAGIEEIWNEADQRWAPVPLGIAGLAELTPLPLIYKGGDPQPWQGLLVAAGQKDYAGDSRFDKASNGGPTYRLRAFAQASRESIDYYGLSDASANLLFTSATDNQRFSVDLDTGSNRDCRRVRLILKNANLRTAGFLEIRTDTGQEIEIANFAVSGAKQASIVLENNGDIRLRPANGRNVVLGSTLEAERIRYQPSAGGPKQIL